jgi:hypothetical protein
MTDTHNAIANTAIMEQNLFIVIMGFLPEISASYTTGCWRGAALQGNNNRRS